MTRKDYQLIAQAINAPFVSDSLDMSDYAERERIANRLADSLKADNPRFDRARFLKACGLED